MALQKKLFKLAKSGLVKQGMNSEKRVVLCTIMVH
jgi:hypothetical protein